jgi:exonuclease III
MNFKLLSYNVWGLNSSGAIPLLKNYIQSVPSLDVVFIQEHKLRLLTTRKLGRALWSHAVSWCLDVSVGYGHDPLTPGAGKGGVLILLHPRWLSNISQSGSILDNRARWFILQGLSGGDIGFVNIYAPNESSHRIRLYTR